VTKSEAKLIIGSGLSCTSKMPCYSLNLSALDCKTGSKLVGLKGTVCEGCYALSGNYQRYKLPFKMQPKTEKINNHKWVDAMTKLILNQGSKKDSNYFRWHDSGDIQSVEHLRKIVLVCLNTPKIKHWIPTREYRMVKEYLNKYGQFPKNLVLRLSAHMIDKNAPMLKNKGQFLPTSSVHKNKPAFGTECESYKNKNECGTCRLCWNPKINNISYKYH